ncbi:MAG: formate dehydrogenase [Proteobacteria bacterium]|nr:formate dehydrogenase [Pseudomonadota bacterium]
MSVLDAPIATGAAGVSRRAVLVGLGGGSVVAGGAVLDAKGIAWVAQTRAHGIARPGQPKPLQAEVTGYHLTDHIRRYYRTARL